MDSEVVHSQVNENDEYQPHNGGSQPAHNGADHEKKSVLKKVKAKAKKLKDTIKKHGHQVLDHGRENSSSEDQNSPVGHDMDEDEKMAQDQQVDGAPVVDESEDVKSVPPTFSQVENFVKRATPESEQVENLGVNSGGSITVTGEAPHQEPRVVGASPTSTETNENIATELQGKTFGEGEKPGHRKVNLERPTGIDEDLHTRGTRPEAYTPPSSYQTTKATDPTGTVDESEDVKSAPPPTFEQVENFVKIATPASEQVENLDELGVNYGDTAAVMGEEPHQEPRVVGASPTSTETNENIATELQGKTFGEEEKPGHSKVNLERPTGFDEDPREQGSRPEAYTPPSSYQTTKATNPTGTVDESKDVKSAPPPTFEQVENFVKIATPASEQVENLDELGVNHGDTTAVMGEEPHQDPRVVGASPTSKTDENIATEPAKTFAGEEKQQPGQGEVNLERPSGFDEDLQTQGRGPEAYTPLNYQTKVNDPTETVHDEIDITPVEKSFERMNVQDEPKPVQEPKVLPDFGEIQYPTAESQDQFVPEPDLSSAAKTQYPPAESYDQNLSELSSASETRYPSERNNDQFVSEISTATETQYPSVETQEKFAPDTITSSTNSNPENPEAIEQTFNSSTATVEEQPQYESVEKPSNQNTYDEKGVADEAVSAENAVASELGYDEKGDRDNKMKILEEEKSEDASNKSGSTLAYGKNIANSLTEKLAPVYGKVAEVGSAVKSKVSGTRTSDGVGAETENVGKGQNKGVSVKDYLAEKLKPGEEDKALSEVISETLCKRKEEPKKASEDEDRNVTKVDSDAIKKQEITGEEHLGSGNGKSERMSEESNVNSPGKSVVGKIKGVVGSWFGKSDENQSSQGGEDLPKNKNTGVEVEQVEAAEGERRLQD